MAGWNDDGPLRRVDPHGRPVASRIVEVDWHETTGSAAFVFCRPTARIDAYCRTLLKQGAVAQDSVFYTLADEELLTGFEAFGDQAEGESGAGLIGRIVDKIAERLEEISVEAIVLVKVEGAELISPSWARGIRRGRAVICETAYQPIDEDHAFRREELAAALRILLSGKGMPEGHGLPMRQDTSGPDGDADDTYTGRRLAEHLEKALFLCPSCLDLDRLRSHGDILGCGCGYEVRYTEMGRLEALHGETLIDTVAAWRCWQYRQLESGFASAGTATAEDLHGADIIGELFHDDHLVLSLSENGKDTAVAEGRLTLYRNRLEFYIGRETFLWYLKDIPDIRLSSDGRLRLGVEDLRFSIRSRFRACLARYAVMVRRMR